VTGIAILYQTRMNGGGRAQSVRSSFSERVVLISQVRREKTEQEEIVGENASSQAVEQLRGKLEGAAFLVT